MGGLLCRWCRKEYDDAIKLTAHYVSCRPPCHNCGRPVYEYPNCWAMTGYDVGETWYFHSERCVREFLDKEEKARRLAEELLRP